MSYLSSLYVAATSIASSLWEINPFSTSDVINFVSTVALYQLSTLASNLATKVAASTNGWIQLNNFVPLATRERFHEFGGDYIGPCNDTIGLVFSAVTRVKTRMARCCFAAPLVEEIVFRSPLLILAPIIDQSSGKLIAMTVYAPGSDGLEELNAVILKVLAAAALCIVFVYAHDAKPTPARAAQLFTVGMSCSVLTLTEGLPGVGVAMIAHGVHNFIAVLEEDDCRAKEGLPPLQSIGISRRDTATN